MKTFVLNDEVSNAPCVATIGFFDGVHRGHQYLIQQVKDVAAQRGLRSTVITFDRHPMEVLNPDYKPQLLNSFNEKLFRLSLTNIDDCAILKFDKQMASVGAYDFMDKILRERLNVKVLVIGYDNHFGHDRKENFDDYVRYGHKLGIDVINAQAFVGNGVNVSSSVVRTCLSEGKVEMAAECLGYPYTISGKVVHGEREGRKLGFPTANIECGDVKIIPSGGAYAVKVRVENTVELKHAMLNIGVRPTFTSSGQLSVEAHLFRFDENIYGKILYVSFIHRLRAEKKFSNSEELVNQLKADAQLVEEQFDKDIDK